MYRAKEAGKGQVRVWSPEMHPAADRARAPARGDRRGAGGRRAGRRTSSRSSRSARARWSPPRRWRAGSTRATGCSAPATFVPAAEATGQVVAIDRVVLEHACVAAAAWDGRDGRPPAGAAVHANLSGVGLRTFEIVADRGGRAPLPGWTRRRLVLEITESVLIADVPMARRTLSALRDLGVRIALDDFGTGHSSLQSPARAARRHHQGRQAVRRRRARTPHDQRADADDHRPRRRCSGSRSSRRASSARTSSRRCASSAASWGRGTCSAARSSWRRGRASRPPHAAAFTA